jgi:hypothetical protein
MHGGYATRPFRLEDYEEEAWADTYPEIRRRRRLTDREIETLVFAGVVGVAAAGLIAGFWAMRRR